MAGDSSTEEFIVAIRFLQDLENKIFDIELFYNVLVKIYVNLNEANKNFKTTLLKSDREKVESGECLIVKVRGPFKNIYKTINYVKALCGSGPAEVGLLYEPHLLPVWVACQGFYLKWLEFDTCLPIVSLTDCGMTVRPVSENILDRFVNKLEDLSNLCEQKSYNSKFHRGKIDNGGGYGRNSNVLTDSDQINQRFYDLLDRCAESKDNFEKLMALPDKAKDKLLYIVKEAGAVFQPTLIRRMSWKENDSENKFRLDSYLDQDMNENETDIEPNKRPLKRRFTAYNDPKNGLDLKSSSNKTEYTTDFLTHQTERSERYSNLESEFERSNSKSSYNSNDDKKKTNLKLPIARTIPASSFINSTSFTSLRRSSLRENTSTLENDDFDMPKTPIKEESSEEIIVISDDDESMLMECSTTSCSATLTKDYIQKEEPDPSHPNYYFPETDSIASWFRTTFLPSTHDTDVIYKSDMLNYFILCFSLDNNKYITTSFYQFVKDFIDSNRDNEYKKVVQKGNTGIRSRKRYVYLKLAANLKPAFVFSINTPTGTPSSTPRVKRKNESLEVNSNLHVNDSFVIAANSLNSYRSRQGSGVASTSSFLQADSNTNFDSRRPSVAMSSSTFSFDYDENDEKVVEEDDAMTDSEPKQQAREQAYTRPETPNLLLQYKISLITVTNPKSKKFKPIIIDGSNVAMCHGNNRRYSCRGIAIIIEYFYKKGHREIISFIPSYRKSKRIENLKPVTHERYLLDQLENLGYIAYTPSRWISGKGRVSAYDDRYRVVLDRCVVKIVENIDFAFPKRCVRPGSGGPKGPGVPR